MPAILNRSVLVVAVLALATPAFGQGKRYALLVGVNAYDSSLLPTLHYAENDAEELARILKEAGYDEVAVLSSSRGKKNKKDAPTAANVRRALERLSGKVKKDDLLLVALSGHGVLWPVLDEKTKKSSEESFFCPQDARPRFEKTLDELKKTMIPLGELFRSLDESGAGVRLLLVDACRNEVKGETKNLDVDNLPRTRKGTAVLFSCKAGERSFEAEKYRHGVFFQHVINGLKGQAKDRRGKITWASLVEHVVEKVTEEVPDLIGDGARQTPHEIRNVEGLPPLLLPLKGEAEVLFREFQGVSQQEDTARALRLFRQASAKGHALADGWVGRMLCLGQGGRQDRPEGLRLIKKALPAVRKKAEDGDADAQTLLGALLSVGLGLEKEQKQAAEWYAKAAAKGQAIAMNNLAVSYQHGHGVEKDERQAVEWLRKAAGKGLTMAAYNLGVTFADGIGVEKDAKKAAEWFRKAADKGHVPAMRKVGIACYHGLGVDKDDKKAAEWYQKAATRSDAEATNNLGVMYQHGEGVEKDEKKAVELFRKAAGKGHALAMANLGVAYFQGLGVKKDDDKAAEWYKKGAEKGDASAMNNLAVMYKDGLSVEMDKKKAVELFTRAAAKGLPLAMNNLGIMHQNGDGMKQDHKKAAEWYRKAAIGGNKHAAYNLAWLYEGGWGVEKDAGEALRWYKKAVALGNADARKKVKELESDRK